MQRPSNGPHARVAAEFAAGLLRSAGIPCEARDRLWKGQGEPSVSIENPDDLHAATETMDTPRKPNGVAWTCPTCRSENEPQFDACWSCGMKRSGTSSSFQEIVGEQ